MRILAISIALSGCGGMSYTIDRDLLRDITIENKLLLFDAENDVSIAIDEREQIQRQIRDLRTDIRDAHAQVREADGDRERAQAKNESARSTLAERARAVFELKITFLLAQIDLLREKLVVQDRVVLVAETKFELAKAKLVKRNNVYGAADVDLTDFEAQVDDAVESARGARQDFAEDEKALVAVKGEWQKAREQLAKDSGGGVGSPWAEDSAAWGNW
jgi:hypothetical protein